jgi:hypothetical protein
VLYLGRGWENYLELLTNFRIDLVHHEGDYNMEGTAYYDVYPVSEMLKYPVIAAFGGTWHNSTAAERGLLSYVEQGGTLVLDASGNLSEPTSFGNSVLFDTVIERQLVPADATIKLDPAFKSRHSSISTITIQPSPWLADGEPWYGAGYSPLPDAQPLKVYATLDGRPLIAERRWGKGRVLWCAYNLPWHAKLTGNPGEAALVSAMLEEAAMSPR